MYKKGRGRKKVIVLDKVYTCTLYNNFNCKAFKLGSGNTTLS
jgi:hypothetical protein